MTAIAFPLVALAALLAAGAAPAAAQGTRTGSIQGRITLAGPPPGNPVIRMGADPLCARANRDRGIRPVQQMVVVGKGGGLANAFVHLQGTFPAAAPPAAPVVMDQQGCIFVPRVLGARVGQTLQVKNSDMTGHTVHAVTLKGNEFNVSQPKGGMVSTVRIRNEEVMLRVRCDIHSWMVGYIGVLPHPYFAVSGAEGTFTIANVPAGRHTIRVWHERYGVQTRSIEVKAGQAATVDFSYTGKEPPPSS